MEPRVKSRGRYSIYERFEEKGLMQAKDIKAELATRGLKSSQVDYWVQLGLVKESEETAKRRQTRSHALRYFLPEEVTKIVYMNMLVNEAGIELRRAAKLAEKLVENKAKNGYHWLEEKNLLIRVPEVKVFP